MYGNPSRVRTDHLHHIAFCLYDPKAKNLIHDSTIVHQALSVCACRVIIDILFGRHIGFIDINFEKALRTGIGIDRLCGDADSPHGAALYWSSSLNVESPSEAYALYLIGFKTIHEILCEYRYYGNGIRPVTE